MAKVAIKSENTTSFGAIFFNDAIQDVFGFNIECDRKNAYLYYRLAKQVATPSYPFTTGALYQPS